MKPGKPTVFSNLPVCSGDTILIQSSSSTSGVKWHWFDSRAKLLSTSDSIILPSNNINQKELYKVFSSLNGCLSDPDSIYLDILENRHPVGKLNVTPGRVVKSGTEITFTIVDTMYLGSNPIFNWYLNGNVIPGLNDTSHKLIMGNTIHTGDEVCFKVGSSYQCRLSDTVSRCVDNFKDLYIQTLSENIHIYPNPATNIVNIHIDGAYGMSLTDIHGKIVLEKKIVHSDNEIDISGLTPGVYLLKVWSRDTIDFVKLLKY